MSDQPAFRPAWMSDGGPQWEPERVPLRKAQDLIDYAYARADGYLSTLLAVHILDASDDELVEMGLPPIEGRHR